MDLFQSLFLGFLQGVFEWLPISSQGQVAVLAMEFLGITAELALKYAIFLHIGTLISAIIYFRKDILEILKMKNKEMSKFLGVAVLATVVTAGPSWVFLKGISENVFLLTLAIGVFLIITGLLQKFVKRKGDAKLGLKNAVFLGLGQGFAVLPGISRSGITTSVLLFEGFDPEKAFKLSFLLSIPSVFLGELAFGIFEGIVIDLNAVFAVGVAAVVGFVSIDLLLKAAKRINFSIFCIVFGLVYVGLAFL